MLFVQATAGMRVHITILAFEVTATNNCDDDYLQINWDGEQLYIWTIMI